MMGRRKNLNDKFGFVEIMEYTSIGESCSVVSGGTPSRSKNQYWENGNIPWIKIGNIKSKYVNEYDELITEQGLNNSSAKLLKKGTILYTIFATLGEVGILDIEACTNQAIAGINITDSRITTDYLYYFLKSKKDYVNNIGRGVAQNNINLTTLKNFEIPLIDVDKQLNIVEILEKVERMIFLKEKEIEDLDLLIKARFIEMFGDAVDNPMEWKKRKLQEVVTDDCTISYGIVQTGNDQEDGVPVFRPVDIVNKIPKLTELKKTTEEISNKYKRTILKGRELLITVRANIADTCIIDEEFKGCNVGRGIVPIRIQEDIMVLEFLKYLLDSKHLNDDIKSKAKGITLIQLNMEDLREVELICPPIEKQMDFVEFAKQVDKSRFDIKKSITELEREVVYD